jgi:multicomponent K+:H+ antiporter subunit G
MTAETIPTWADLLASLLLIAGSMLALIGSAGLLRLSSLLARIHAPTLGNTLGLNAVLLASMLIASIQANHPVFQELLITLFILVTSPVTAILLMRSGIYRKRGEPSKKELPPDTN